MEYCKKLNVRNTKEPGVVTWFELENDPKIIRYCIYERDPFFRWKAKAIVCYNIDEEVTYDMPKEKRFLYLYMNYRGLVSIKPNEFTYFIKFLCKRFNRCMLYKYLTQNENSRGFLSDEEGVQFHISVEPTRHGT